MFITLLCPQAYRYVYCTLSCLKDKISKQVFMYVARTSAYISPTIDIPIAATQLTYGELSTFIRVYPFLRHQFVWRAFRRINGHSIIMPRAWTIHLSNSPSLIVPLYDVAWLCECSHREHRFGSLIPAFPIQS